MFLDINEIDLSNVKSGFLKQYIDLKKENTDAILLFQIGDFFETFFEDAKTFSLITGVTLGARSVKGVGEVIQAGIPSHAVELYIKKLINENYKVCICEQFKNDDDTIIREVTRKYTKGTIIENEFLESSENNYICALYEIGDNVLISYADVSTGQFYKSCGTYEDIVFEIDKITPNEILVLDEQSKKFNSILKKYNSTILCSDFFKTKKIEDVILKYCAYTQKKYMPKMDDIIEYKINSFLVMDDVTRRNLEIRRTRRNLKKRGSLLWFLDYTKTPMGNRLLKKYLDEPLMNAQDIEKRLDAVGEVIEKQDFIKKFDDLLEQFCDLSRMSAKISNSTISPKDLFLMVKNAKVIETFVNDSMIFSSPLLKFTDKCFGEVVNFLKKTQLALSENSSDLLQSGGIINEGYDSNLDYLRAKLKKCENSLDAYFEHEKKCLKIEKMKLNYSKNIGYSFEIPVSKEKLLTREYFKKQSLSGCLRFSTEKLQRLEDEISALKYKINEYEYQLYCDIRSEAFEFVDKIRNIAKEIARFDVIVSLAKCAIKNKLTRAKFVKNNISIKGGYHPGLIEFAAQIVKNDTELSDDSMIILTGANMSGKSTYLKHNAIICLLAQIGSYVPADFAQVAILDRIFVRQGSTDDIVNNSSSFMVEMMDLKFVLNNMTKDSLILLDEPAKSTNATEGGAIAMAFCEYLLKYYKTKIMIATHNLELTKLENKYPNRVFNYVIGAFDDAKTVGTDRKVSRGIVSSSLAINTAILAGLPIELINSARKNVAN